MNKDIELSIKILQLATNNTVIISGSYALKKLKIINREPQDLDIILPNYVDLSHLGTIVYNDNTYIDKSYTLTMTQTGVSVDVIIDNTRRYFIIYGVRISHKEEILLKKFEALLYFGSDKHVEDLKKYLLSIKSSDEFPL